MGGGKYCDRMKREHKNNNQYIEVDLFLSLAYMRCFDEECKDWKGDPVVLPPSSRPWFNYFDEEF